MTQGIKKSAVAFVGSMNGHAMAVRFNDMNEAQVFKALDHLIWAVTRDDVLPDSQLYQKDLEVAIALG